MGTKFTRLADHAQFNWRYGFFWNAWSTAEAAFDCAIGKFLRLSHAETHILTAGMEHGRKATLLRGLIRREDHPKKAELLRALNVIQNESLRNVFAHSYIASDDKIITFVERSRGGPFKAAEHHFTLEEFHEHVTKFAKAAVDFYDAVGFEPLELEAFQHAALSVNSSE